MYTELGQLNDGSYGVIEASAELLHLPSANGIRMSRIDLRHSRSTAELMIFSGWIALRAQVTCPQKRPPITAADFLASQYIFWIEQDHHITPVGGYRTVGAADCQKADVALPVFPVIHDASAKQHEQAVLQILGQYPIETIAFSSHLMFAPRARRTRDAATMIELVAASLCQDLRDRYSIGLGWATAETEKFFERIGYQRVSYNGAVLPPLPCNYTDSPVTLIAITSPTDYAQECLAKHQGIIDALQ